LLFFFFAFFNNLTGLNNLYRKLKVEGRAA